MTSGIGLNSVNHQLLTQQYQNSHKVKSTYGTSTKAISNDSYVSSQGNTCTDGKDDCKISIFSKIGNTIQGAGKALGNMVKSAIEHPFKTLAMVGACCIPVVGPAIAIGLGAYGAYQGVKTVATGISQANNAKTDAEAKDAWENIGNGTFTTAASAVAIKGGAHMLKNQLSVKPTLSETGESILAKSGESGSTVANFKTNLAKVKNSNVEFGKVDLIKATVKDGAAETLTNAKAVGNFAKDKAKAGLEKAKEIKTSVQENGIKQTAQNYAKAGLEKVKTKVDLEYNKVNEKITKTNLKNAKTQRSIDYYKKLIDEGKVEVIEKYPGTDTPKTIRYKESTSTVTLDKKGAPIGSETPSSGLKTSKHGNTRTIEEGYYNDKGEF
ncbi:hypothetical protein IJ670_02670, partial [bacterium]|nr:hypothetical protein [bacterium]